MRDHLYSRDVMLELSGVEWFRGEFRINRFIKRGNMKTEEKVEVLKNTIILVVKHDLRAVSRRMNKVWMTDAILNIMEEQKKYKNKQRNYEINKVVFEW